MSRIRTLKPEFWADAKVGRLSLGARLLFIGMWNFSDDYGVVSASTRRTLGEVFENDESILEHDILRWFDELLDLEFIQEFEANEKRWFFIKNWDKHQKIDKRSTRKNPDPTKGKLIHKIKIEEDSAESRRSLGEDSALEIGKGKGKGKGIGSGKGNNIPLADAKGKKNKRKKTDYSPEFEEVWAATSGHRRQEDDKAGIYKKFIKVMDSGLEFDEIKQAINIWASVNKARSPEFRIGLRRFLEVQNVKDYLENGPPKKPEDDGLSDNMRGVQQLIDEYEGSFEGSGSDNLGLEEPDEDDGIQGEIDEGGF